MRSTQQPAAENNEGGYRLHDVRCGVEGCGCRDGRGLEVVEEVRSGLMGFGRLDRVVGSKIHTTLAR